MAYLQVGNARGGKALIIDEYRYLRNKEIVGEKTYWRCTRCNMFVHTRWLDVHADPPAEIVVVRPPGDHGHAPEAELVRCTALIERMLQRVAADPTIPVKRVYDEAVAQAAAAELRFMPPWNSVKSRLERRRASLMPPIPATVQEVQVEGEWALTWSGHEFLAKHHVQQGFVAFGTEANYTKLSQCNQIYMDGTFKTCPRPFYQMCAIHGRYLGRVVPFVFVLMSGKTTEMYSAVLRHVKRRVARLTGQPWNPTRVLTDYEMGLMNAFRQELPAIEVTGCYFHLCQSFWRKVQDIGLAGPYRQDQNLREWVRKIMATGYLPVALLRVNFRAFIRSPMTRRLLRQYPPLGDFIQYLEDTYVGEQALFPPDVWCVFGRSSDSRSNNWVEAWHHRWNLRVERRRPSLWVFIRKLKDEQRTVESNCLHADRGEQAPPKRRKWRVMEERLRRIRRQYTGGERTLEQYWEAVQYCVHNFV